MCSTRASFTLPYLRKAPLFGSYSTVSRATSGRLSRLSTESSLSGTSCADSATAGRATGALSWVSPRSRARFAPTLSSEAISPRRCGLSSLPRLCFSREGQCAFRRIDDRGKNAGLRELGRDFIVENLPNEFRPTKDSAGHGHRDAAFRGE